jgi:hypothetical protein
MKLIKEIKLYFVHMSFNGLKDTEGGCDSHKEEKDWAAINCSKFRNREGHELVAKEHQMTLKFLKNQFHINCKMINSYPANVENMVSFYQC